MPGVSDPLDWDEASRAVADAYFANELHPLTRSTAENVFVEGAKIGPVRIVFSRCRIEYVLSAPRASRSKRIAKPQAATVSPAIF